VHQLLGQAPRNLFTIVPSVNCSGKCRLCSQVTVRPERQPLGQIPSMGPEPPPITSRVSAPRASTSTTPLSRTSTARASHQIKKPLPQTSPCHEKTPDRVVRSVSRTSAVRASLTQRALLVPSINRLGKLLHLHCTIPNVSPWTSSTRAAGHVPNVNHSSKLLLGPRWDIPNVNRSGKFKQMLHALRQAGSAPSGSNQVPSVNRLDKLYHMTA